MKLKSSQSQVKVTLKSRCGLGRPGAAWGGLGRPGARWGCVGRPGAAWGGLGRPGAAWLPGAAWGGLGRLGAAWDSLGRPGVASDGLGRPRNDFQRFFEQLAKMLGNVFLICFEAPLKSPRDHDNYDDYGHYDESRLHP